MLDKVKSNITNLYSFILKYKKAFKWGFLIFVAFFTGFIYLLYYIILYSNLKTMGHPAFPIDFPEQGQLLWLALRVREMINGYWWVSDVGFFEHRYDFVSLRPLLPPAVYFFISLFIGVKYLFAIGDFLIVVGSFLFIFALCYLITKKYFVSLFFTFMFFILKDLLSFLFPQQFFIDSINELKDFIKLFLPYVAGENGIDRLQFLRADSTRPGFLFYIPTLIFLFLFLKKQTFKYVILSGLFFGILFYVYPFFWIYITIVMGILTFIFFLKKDFKNLWKCIYIFVIGWGIGIGAFLNQLKIKALPQYQAIADHNFGIEYGHRFTSVLWMWYVAYICSAIFIYVYAKKHKKLYISYFFTGLLLANIIATNIQVVLGFNIMPLNWHTHVASFTVFLSSVFLFSILFDSLYKKYKFATKILPMLMVLLVAIEISGSIHSQVVLVERKKVDHTLSKGVAESIIWVDENLPKDSVILSPYLRTNTMLLLNTGSRTFIQKAFLGTASHEERVERLLFVNSFFGVESEQFKKILDDSILELYGLVAGHQQLDPSVVSRHKELVEAMKQEVSVRYEKYDIDWSEVLSKYRVDFVFYGPDEKKLTKIDFSKMKFLENVYDNGSVEIYKLLKDKI